MKAIFVSFNQAYYEMILNVMDRNNIRGFTSWNDRDVEVRPASPIMEVTPGRH